METLALTTGVIYEALQAVLLIVFLRRKGLRQRFPAFFAYVVYAFLANAARVSIFHSSALYFPLYWATEIGYSGLALLAVREAAQRAWQIACKKRRWLRPLPFFAVFTIVSIACWRALYRPWGLGTGDFAHFAAGAYSFVMGAECLQGIAFLLCLRLRKARRPVWRQRFGILAGFGVLGLVNFVAIVAQYNFGAANEDVFRYAPTGAFLGVAAVWLVIFLRREPEGPRSRPRPLTVDERLEMQRRDQRLLETIKKELGLRIRLNPGAG